jgi:hypothetical protein
VTAGALGVSSVSLPRFFDTSLLMFIQQQQQQHQQWQLLPEVSVLTRYWIVEMCLAPYAFETSFLIAVRTQCAAVLLKIFLRCR